MDSSNKDNLGDIKVSKDDIIENVAEKILTQEKIVGVVDSNNNIIGSIKLQQLLIQFLEEEKIVARPWNI